MSDEHDPIRVATAAAMKPERTLRFSRKRERGDIRELRARMLDRVRSVYVRVAPDDPLEPTGVRHDVSIYEWARSASGSRLVTVQDWIGLLYDGATSRYFLLLADGSSVHTWLGEDYGHEDYEVELVGPAALDEAIDAAFAELPPLER